MNKNRRILFICDSGIGDLVISLPWIKYYSKLKNCETIICTKKIHSDFLEMVDSDFNFINFSIDKLESLIKENSLVNKSINSEFIIQNFTFQEDRENDLKENKKTKDKMGSKTTSEEKNKA